MKLALFFSSALALAIVGLSLPSVSLAETSALTYSAQGCYNYVFKNMQYRHDGTPDYDYCLDVCMDARRIYCTPPAGMTKQQLCNLVCWAVMLNLPDTPTATTETPSLPSTE